MKTPKKIWVWHLPEKKTLDELQVYATKPPRKDGKNNSMLTDVISKFCAAALLRLESGEVVRLPKTLMKDIEKYNRIIRKAQREAETKAQAKTDGEAKAKVKVEAEAQAKAKAKQDEDFPTEFELNQDTDEKYAEVAVCLRFDT